MSHRLMFSPSWRGICGSRNARRLLTVGWLKHPVRDARTHFSFPFPPFLFNVEPRNVVWHPTLRAGLSQPVFSGKALGSLPKVFTHMRLFLLKIALSPL